MSRGRTPGSLAKKTIEKIEAAAGISYKDLPEDRSPLESDDQIKERIRKRFHVLDRMIVKSVNLDLRSLVIAGAPGCGKTYAVEDTLRQAADEGFINYTELKGTTSAIGLYQTLYNCRDAGNYLLIDDCDAIFAYEDIFNILKAALDTSGRRVVSWNKESRILADNGIPQNFIYDGNICFITNKNIAAEADKTTKMAPHFRALLSRSTYVDLGIHSKREILVRIDQIIHDTGFLDKNDFSETMGELIIEWLKEHLNRLHTLDIRVAQRLGILMRDDPDWRETADVILCRMH